MTTAVARPGLHKPDEENDERIIFRDRIFATQDYLPFVIGSLRLGDKIDMSRLRRDQVKVLVGHDGKLSVGKVNRARHDVQNSVFRSDFEIPKIDATLDTRERIANDLMRDISVGGIIYWHTVTLDNEDTIDEWDSIDDALWTAHGWLYVEQSLTPIPLDPRAGIDRDSIGNLLRDNKNLIVFDADGVIMHRDMEAVHRPRLMERIDGRRNRRMTTLAYTEEDLQAAVQRTIAERDEKARREAEAAVEAQKQQQSVEDLRRQMEELRGTAGNLEAARAKAETELAERVQREEAQAIETKTLIETLQSELNTEREARAAEENLNREFRDKLNSIQFQPGGQVLQVGNWNPAERALSIGRIIGLTVQSGALGTDRLTVNRSADTTLEESWLEREKDNRSDHSIPASAIARIPLTAIAERERHLMLQRATMANAAAGRPVEIQYMGDAGLILSRYAPILARMDVRMGVSGGQRLPYLSTQPTASAGAENASISVSNAVLSGDEKLPVPIAVGFELSSSLRAVDDGTFESLVGQIVYMVLNNELVSEVLVGGGSNEISGIWNTGSLPNVNYGAAVTDFNRDDILDLFENVELADTDGGNYTFVASTGLWKLCRKTPRGTAGTSSAGYTEIQRFLLETRGDMMGDVEGHPAFHYADLTPSGINDPGLFFKADRVRVWIWGDSLFLEYVPTMTRKNDYKLVVEANYAMIQPTKNAARIKRGA